MKIKILIIALFMLFCSPLQGICGEIQEAQAFFNQFVRDTNGYNPELLGLYEENAKIIRMVMNGDEYKALNIPLGTYKAKIKYYSKIARLLNYKNCYSGLKFIAENGNVRIKGQRTPTTGGGSLPMQMLLGKNQQGNWVIKEEIFYTKSKAFLKFLQ